MHPGISRTGPRILRIPAAEKLFLVVVGLLYLAHCLWSLRRIQSGEVSPFSGNDTCTYLIMADLSWLDPAFYAGFRPPTIPFIWSFFSQGADTRGIIAFQTMAYSLSWLIFASVASGIPKHRSLRILLFCLLLLYSLNAGIIQYTTHLLSESLSLAFMVLTLSALLLFYRKPGWIRLYCVLAVSLLFGFSRDTNAYLLLCIALILLLVEAYPWIFRNRAFSIRQTAQPGLIILGYVGIFLASSQGAGHLNMAHRNHCFGEQHPIVKHALFDKLDSRHLFPLLNVFDVRILPYEFRRRHFEDRGLVVTEAMLAKKFHWASQNEFEWYREEPLQDGKEWISRHGKSTYIRYLLLHPRYTLVRPWQELRTLYAGPSPILEGGLVVESLAWLGIPLRILHGEARFLTWLAMLLFPLHCWLRRRNPGALADDPAAILVIPAASIAIWGIALLIYHGDAMDVERHSFGNIVSLDLLATLSSFYLMDRLAIQGRFMSGRRSEPATGEDLKSA